MTEVSQSQPVPAPAPTPPANGKATAWPSFLTEGVLLAVATVFAYGTGWLYNAGELAAMGVPADFSDLSVNTGTLLSLFVLVPVFGGAANFAMRRTPIPRWEKGAFLTFAAVACVIGIWRMPLGLSLFSGLGTVAAAIIAIMTDQWRGQRVIVALAVVGLTILLAFALGIKEVEVMKRFTIVRNGQSEWILASVRDERLICVPFNGATKIAGPGFVIMEPSSALTLSLETTGIIRFVTRVYAPPPTSSAPASPARSPGP